MQFRLYSQGKSRKLSTRCSRFARMDNLSPQDRSAMMARIRSTATKPERIVLTEIRRRRFKCLLNVRDLPGRPDILLPNHGQVIFVHGCFWHGHEGCKLAYKTKSNQSFWEPKLEGNRLRDLRVCGRLRRMGYKVAVIWECETRNPSRVHRRVSQILNRLTIASRP
jgi:DNA mismatch endonuclease, patch repair protein